MQVKKYEAPSLQEALDTIKRELGPEAIVLQTRHNKRRFGLLSKPSVEVTVAISARSAGKKKVVEEILPAQTKAQIEKMPARDQADTYEQFFDREVEKRTQRVKDSVQLSSAQTPAVSGRKITERRYIDIPDDESSRPVRAAVETRRVDTSEKQELRGEVERLRKMILEMKTSQDAVQDRSSGKLEFSKPGLQAGFDQLVVAGVDRRYAYSLVKQLEFAQTEPGPLALADELLRSIPTSSILGGLQPKGDGQTSFPQVIFFVGPAGSGKSSLLGKCAVRAAKDRKLRVAVASLGERSVGGSAVLESIAKLFQIPHRNFANAAELKAALRDYLAFDVLWVDTPSLAAKDQERLRALEAELNTIENGRRYAVLSATMRDVELAVASKQLLTLRPMGLAFTHIDEALSHGQILNTVERTHLPLVAFGTGQRVPEDLEAASAERLTSLLLDLK